MEKTQDSQKPSVGVEEDENEIQRLLLTLPRVKLSNSMYLYQYQGFWIAEILMHGLVSFQKYFQPKSTDIFLACFPKCGTTWLKAITFTIMNRSRYTFENSPLLTANPHELIPLAELDLYNENPFHFATSPRIVATHASYTSLPHSILNSDCRIVYICRNPLDQFVSLWHFYRRWNNQDETEGKFSLWNNQDETEGMFSLEELFEMMCDGTLFSCPFWEHVLGYWNASKKEPNKILFLKYEDLREDTVSYVKKLASFMGHPFSKDEEVEGVAEKITKLCSFDSLKSLEVNQTGEVKIKGPSNGIFFRKGEVGDWKNYITSSMAERLGNLVEEKLSESGLTFSKYQKIN